MHAPPSAGIHHVTAISGEPQRLVEFYVGMLGVRLVKRTVNFDDPGTYHFYFGNDTGAPGTLLTCFPWPGARRGRVGAGQVTETAFAVPPGTLDWWTAHLTACGVAVPPVLNRFDAPALTFEDPDGLRLALVEHATAAGTSGAVAAPDAADPRVAITGLHGTTLSVRVPEDTGALLAAMGFRVLATDGARSRYVADGSAHSGSTSGACVDLVRDADGPEGRGGAGTVHHIAWRTTDAGSQQAWQSALRHAGAAVSPVMDRCYFESIYFREPNGVLFEIATDGPGFATDEPQTALGEELMLPSWLESDRAAIAAALPPLRVPARGAVGGDGADRPRATGARAPTSGVSGA